MKFQILTLMAVLFSAVLFADETVELTVVKKPPLELRCNSMYRITGHHNKCRVKRVKVGPSASQTYDTETISLIFNDEEHDFYVHSTYQPNTNTAQSATVRVTDTGATNALGTANLSLLDPLGGSMVLNLGAVEIQNPDVGCNYHRYLFIRCSTRELALLDEPGASDARSDEANRDDEKQ